MHAGLSQSWLCWTLNLIDSWLVASATHVLLLHINTSAVSFLIGQVAFYESLLLQQTLLHLNFDGTVDFLC